jgi:hypothetical protein
MKQLVSVCDENDADSSPYFLYNEVLGNPAQVDAADSVIPVYNSSL